MSQSLGFIRRTTSCRRNGGRRVVLALLLAIVWSVTLAQPARADNCGSLSDCFFTLAAALGVIAGVAFFVGGGIWILGALGGITIGAGGVAVIGGSVAIPAAAATAFNVAQAAAAAALAAGSISMMSRPTGKERGSDIPSWAKGSRPSPGETPRQAADRVLTERYGPGGYKKGPGGEHNMIKKFFERLLRLERKR
jgi:hypothetical protein